jgi:RNA polymerase sigma-70 factor (ECF subfamily)
MLMQHRTALYAYLLASVRNHATAEDLLQDVSVAVLESLAQLQDEQGFLPWAREIARRRILASQRESKRVQAVDPDLMVALADAADRIERQTPTSSLQDALRQCLDGLPGESRQIVLQRYQNPAGGIEQLAERLQRSVQAVYAILKRVKVSLRECVERRLAGEVRT